MLIRSVCRGRVRQCLYQYVSIVRNPAHSKRSSGPCPALNRASCVCPLALCSLEQAELDLVGEKERLQVALGACQQEVGGCRQELEQMRAEHSQLVGQLRASHKEERTRLQQELEAGQRGQKSLEEELAACQLDNKKVRVSCTRRGWEGVGCF